MYTFNTINDKDFEVLTRDLLNRSLNLKFQEFKYGKDGGIDLRYSTPEDENKIIVQAKHYPNSNIADLKSKLKHEEFSKIERLNPSRYILVTSLGLTPKNKEDLKEIASPYIKSTNDIYGQSELCSLLRDYEDIEEKHFKLYLSSTTVLNRILHNGISGRSKFAKEKIVHNSKIFVFNQRYSEAIKLLNKNNFVLIVGEAGIGKTMMADMLTYQLLDQEYELVYALTVEEAEHKYNSNIKQVFYLDDFLGANYYDLSLARNNDSAIAMFLQRFKHSNTKKLILTSRTIVLNRAKEDSEKLSRSKIDIEKHEIRIKDYSKFDKAQILYNHIFFTNLPDQYKNVFFHEEYYNKVINHRNYNPRLLEFFTDHDNFIDIEPASYKDFILYNLANPEEVYRKCYEKQTSENGKFMLHTLFSLRLTNENILKAAHSSRIDHEIQKNGYVKTINLYNKSLIEILGSFINKTIVKNDDYENIYMSFYNPSIVDFLLKYFSNSNLEEKWEILDSAIYFEQFTYRFTTKGSQNKIIINNEDKPRFEKIYWQKYDSLKTTESFCNSKIAGINSTLELFDYYENKSLIDKKIELIDLDIDKYTTLDWYGLIDLFKALDKCNLLNIHTNVLKKLFEILIFKSTSIYNLSKVIELMNENESFNNFYQELILDKEIHSKIQSNFNIFWDNNYEKFILESDIVECSEEKIVLEDSLIQVKANAKQFNAILKIKDPKIFETIELDLDELLELNIERNRFSKELKDVSISSLDKNKIDEEKEIKKLFQKFN